jgi:hypothetical protein
MGAHMGVYTRQTNAVGAWLVLGAVILIALVLWLVGRRSKS